MVVRIKKKMYEYIGLRKHNIVDCTRVFLLHNNNMVLGTWTKLSCDGCMCCRNPVIKFSKTKTVVGRQLSPEVAFFSSRGPSSLSPSVLKVLIIHSFIKAIVFILTKM